MTNSDLYKEILFIIRKSNPLFPEYNVTNNSDNRHEYIKSILFAVSNISEGLWASLSNMAQGWYNESVCAIQDGKMLDFLPGLPEEYEATEVPVITERKKITVPQESPKSFEPQFETHDEPTTERKGRGRPKKQKTEKVIVKNTSYTKKGVDTTDEDKKKIRSFILFESTTKESVIKYIVDNNIKINPLVLHRMYIEGSEYSKLIKK